MAPLCREVWADQESFSSLAWKNSDSRQIWRIAFIFYDFGRILEIFVLNFVFEQNFRLFIINEIRSTTFFLEKKYRKNKKTLFYKNMKNISKISFDIFYRSASYGTKERTISTSGARLMRLLCLLPMHAWYAPNILYIRILPFVIFALDISLIFSYHNCFLRDIWRKNESNQPSTIESLKNDFWREISIFTASE